MRNSTDLHIRSHGARILILFMLERGETFCIYYSVPLRRMKIAGNHYSIISGSETARTLSTV